MKEKLRTSIDGVARWVEAHHYEAYDPGDGNLSYLHALTFNILTLERILQQSVYRAPLNLRPLLGIKPHVSTKGKGYMAWGYLKMYKLTGRVAYAERAKACLDWLIQNKSPYYRQFCWGNHFPFCTRSGRTPKLEPIVPWTVLIGQAFLEAYETFNDSKYLDVLVSVTDWILSLPRERTDSGTCISYVAFKQNSIHNSNMLAGALLAQVGRLTGDCQALDVAKEAMVYSCSRQQTNGAWLYGEASKYHWNDNFHTGYNLDCLKRYIDTSEDQTFGKNLRDGFDFFKRQFFEGDGRPKYYDKATYPTDIQCAAQAIDTLTFFSDLDNDALSLALKVANWTIDHLQDRDGHFYYRDLGWIMVRTPMLHWGQGTMFKALVHLLSKLEDHPSVLAPRKGEFATRR
jgi:rhamnogalacturonyl hydrolase YesR